MKLLFIALILLTHLSLSAQVTFTQNQAIDGRFPDRAIFADFDGDSDLDMVRVIDQATGFHILNANEIWLNDGNGNFTFHMSFGNSESKGVAVGDLNNDTYLDLFVVNYSFEGVEERANKVWLNDGNGNFVSNGQSLGTRNSVSVVLGDFDSDGDLDAFVANGGGSGNRGNRVWLNDGNGQFSDSGQNLGNRSTSNVELSDVDSDNDLDIVVTNISNGGSDPSNRVWLNNGTGVFSDSGQSLGTTATSEVAVLDLNDDGFPDFVFSNTFEDSETYVNDGNGNFTFFNHVLLNADGVGKRIKSADLDNDGDEDLVACFFSNTHHNRVLINNGNGTFTEDFSFGIANTVDIAIGDIDGDNFNDVLLLNINFQPSTFWLNDGIRLNVPSFNVSKPFLYPNPSHGATSVDLRGIHEKVNITIYDLQGKEINRQSLDDVSKIDLDTSNYASGIYILKINSGSVSTSIKMIVN